jgi:hypothetical protein
MMSGIGHSSRLVVGAAAPVVVESKIHRHCFVITTTTGHSIQEQQRHHPPVGSIDEYAIRTIPMERKF